MFMTQNLQMRLLPKVNDKQERIRCFLKKQFSGVVVSNSPLLNLIHVDSELKRGSSTCKGHDCRHLNNKTAISTHTITLWQKSTPKYFGEGKRIKLTLLEGTSHHKKNRLLRSRINSNCCILDAGVKKKKKKKRKKEKRPPLFRISQLSGVFPCVLTHFDSLRLAFTMPQVKKDHSVCIRCNTHKQLDHPHPQSAEPGL